MSFEDRETLTAKEIPKHVSGHIICSMSQWSIIFLQQGKLLLDSGGTAGCAGEIERIVAPATVPRVHMFEVKVECTNTAEAVGSGLEAYQHVGSVRIGPDLDDENTAPHQFRSPPSSATKASSISWYLCDETARTAPFRSETISSIVYFVAEF